MRKLLLAFAFAIVATPALAQNTTCSNRPSGDSSNACANTRFVHGAALEVGTLNVQLLGLKADGTTPNGPLLQTLLDANPTATFVFPPGAGCYNIAGPIYLSDSTGRNFSGKLIGTGGCITFTNAGSATDPEISTQRGFVAYPKVNGPGGDITGVLDVQISNLNMTCPTNGTCIHLTNSQQVQIDHNKFDGGRWGLVTETGINFKINRNRFNNQFNGGIGLLMLGDTARVWYGSATPSSSYWNDSPNISDNLFAGNIVGALAFIVDMGSQSERVRTISNNVFFTTYTPGNDTYTQYGYVSRNANPTFIGANWSEGVAFPIRTLNTNATESTNLSGVSASQPSGVYAVNNFVDGFSYNMTVMGFSFNYANTDINCGGISGNCVVGGNTTSQVSGVHLLANQTPNNIIDLGDVAINFFGSGIYKFLANGAKYNNLATAPEFQNSLKLSSSSSPALSLSNPNLPSYGLFFINPTNIGDPYTIQGFGTGINFATPFLSLFGLPTSPTGAVTGSLCLDSLNHVYIKTTSGSCL